MNGTLAKAVRVTVVATAAALALAACGSSGSSSSGGPASSTGLAAATKVLKAAAKAPTTLGIDVPLTKAPARGKSIFFIGNETPDGLRVNAAVKEAAAALGWKVTVLNYDVNNFASGNTAVAQAIQAKADYIIYLSIPASVLAPGIAKAKAAGIPMFAVVAPDAPDKAAWRFSDPAGIPDFEHGARLNADYVISKSAGKADTLLVAVPSIPSQKAYVGAFHQEMAKNCPSCGLTDLSVQYADVTGGAVPAKVVSFLRSHPKVDNVVFSVGAFSTGFATAAKAAGITLGSSGVRVTVYSNSPGNLADIKSGVQDMGIGLAEPWAGWMTVDAVARYSLGMDLKPNWDTKVPVLLQTKANVTDTNTLYAGPDGYQEQFKKLWKVG